MTANKKTGAAKILRATILYVGIIVAAYLLFSLICIIIGNPYLPDDSAWVVFMTSVVYTAIVGWALLFNVPSGRFDFSVGSIMLLSVIVGTNLAQMLNCDGIVALILSIIAGAVLGGISGFCYITFRLPAMITSLGVTMIFEAFSFVLWGGNGVNIVGRDSYFAVGAVPGIYVILIITMAVMGVILNFTKFGYEKKALMGGQKIAVNAGIKEKGNAVICYVLAGALMAIAGYISMCRTGYVSAKLSMGTIGAMFTGFLPMFIGMFLMRYGEVVSGVFVGAILQVMLNTLFVRIGLSSSVQSIINAFVLLGFLVFQNYFGGSIMRKAVKARKKELLGNQNEK